MEVQIIEISTNKLIATYPIILDGQNYTVQLHDFHNVAWSNAVADGLVNENDREKYTFHLVGEN